MTCKISLTKDGFTFRIDPNKNDAIVFVDIPYAKVKLRQATSRRGRATLCSPARSVSRPSSMACRFAMEKLGYGLNDKNMNSKVNGVKATGEL